LDQIISKKELQPEINAIMRENGKKIISVQADKISSAVLSDITSAINTIIANHPLPEGLQKVDG